MSLFSKSDNSKYSSNNEQSPKGDNIFLILLPRKIPQGQDAQQEVTIDAIRQQIANAERIMAAIGGLKSKTGGKFSKGNREQVSFEIVAHKGKISFYVVVPDQLLNYMVQQIRSSYPDIELEPIADYNMFHPTGTMLGSYLKLTEASYFPLKTYKNFDSDPFESLTNTLSKIAPDESIAIQYIVSSAPASWRNEGKKAISKIRKGESIYEKKSGGGIGSVIADQVKLMAKDTMGTASSSTPKPPEPDGPKRLSPKEEEMAKMIEDKNAKAGLEANIRVLATGPNEAQLRLHLDNIVNGFNQYNIYHYGNSLKASTDNIDKFAQDFIFRKFNTGKKMVLNTEELTSLFHFPLPTTSTPNIRWLTSRKAPAPVNLPTEGVTLGTNIYRNEERVVHISDADRRRHMYVIGTTGVGKSVLLQHVALQDIELGRGMGVIDPHGDLVEYLLENMPPERYEDVVLFEPANMDFPVGLNMLEARTPHEKDFLVQEMIQMFYKLVSDPSMLGPMFEHYMRNAMLLMMSNPELPGTITEIPRIFTDDEYRKSLMPHLTDPVVRSFWEKEWEQTGGQAKSDMLGYLVSKVGRFIENEMMRNIIGQPHSSINFKDVLRDKKILLVNLSKGKIGDMNSTLMGMIVVSKLQVAAFAQAELPENERKDFYLFIDEFQNYTTDSISTILSEARKYRLNMTMAHQYLGQLVKNGDSSIRDAVLGNVGSMISFRIGVEDAPTIAQQMAPVFSEYDLVNMERYNAAIKMLVNNTVERAFSLKTFPPRQGDPRKMQLLRELSSRKYGQPRAKVEAEIMERSKLGTPNVPDPLSEGGGRERTL